MLLGLTELNHSFPAENLKHLHILKAIYHKVSSSGMHNYFQISLSLNVLYILPEQKVTVTTGSDSFKCVHLELVGVVVCLFWSDI